MKTSLTKENTLIAIAMEEEFNLEQANGWRIVYTDWKSECFNLSLPGIEGR